MIRVTTNEDDHTQPVIIIDGQLSGESVAIVESFMDGREAGRNPGTLYLRDVTTVDDAGKALLLRLVHQGITLRASGLYTSYLVESLDHGRQPAASPDGQPRKPGRKRKAP